MTDASVPPGVVDLPSWSMLLYLIVSSKKDTKAGHTDLLRVQGTLITLKFDTFYFIMFANQFQTGHCGYYLHLMYVHDPARHAGALGIPEVAHQLNVHTKNNRL